VAAGRPDGSVTAAALREALAEHDDVALISIMWANTRSAPSCRLRTGAVAAEFDIPMHSDAIQAVGQLPVDFARVAFRR